MYIYIYTYVYIIIYIYISNWNPLKNKKKQQKKHQKTLTKTHHTYILYPVDAITIPLPIDYSYPSTPKYNAHRLNIPINIHALSHYIRYR